MPSTNSDTVNVPTPIRETGEILAPNREAAVTPIVPTPTRGSVSLLSPYVSDAIVANTPIDENSTSSIQPVRPESSSPVSAEPPTAISSAIIVDPDGVGSVPATADPTGSVSTSANTISSHKTKATKSLPTTTPTNTLSPAPTMDSTRTANSSGTSSTGFSQSVVIGATIGAAAGTMIIGLVAFLLYRRRRKYNRSRLPSHLESGNEGSSDSDWMPSEKFLFGWWGSQRRKEKEMAEMEDTSRRELADTGKVEMEAENMVHELPAASKLSVVSAGGDGEGREGMIVDGEKVEVRKIGY